MKNKQTIKVVFLTSLIWITLAAAGIAVVKYGEYQKTQGMLEGFTQAKQILNEK